MVSFTWSAVTVRKNRADLRAQKERTPLVRAHREHRKKEHGLHQRADLRAQEERDPCW